MKHFLLQVLKYSILLFLTYCLFGSAQDDMFYPSSSNGGGSTSTTSSSNASQQSAATMNTDHTTQKTKATASNAPKVTPHSHDQQDLQLSGLLQQIQMLTQRGESEANKQKIMGLWQEVLEVNPRFTNAHLQLGFQWITNLTDPVVQRKGFTLLERALDSNYVDNPIPLRSPQAFMLGQLIGRFRWEKKEYEAAQHYLDIARKANPGDVCTEVLMATMIDPYPESIEAANMSMELHLQRMDALLQKADRNNGRLMLDRQWINMIPGALPDAYVHCVGTLFYHSFYYNHNVTNSIRKHYQIATKVWPELNYINPNLFTTDGVRFHKRSGTDVTKASCQQRKIRLGIASAHFREGSSVAEDFKGVIKNLPRDIFDVHHIYIMENPGPPAAVMRDIRDSLTVIKKEMDDSEGYHKWMEYPRKQIEALDLDVLLYLDLTMSPRAHRLAMSRLAPVQAVSHGHPMTSGFPRSALDYYISWAGAELPIEIAQQHYTEELKLLPANKLHQYYVERSMDGQSLVDQQNYKHIVDHGRSSFPTVPADGNWYLIMQKPFKLMPEFDPIVAGILEKDPNGRVIMHEEESEILQKVFIKRLTRAGCDMNRVHFMPVLPHHRLMALYTLSDVILDSYPAGGCTTTREVLEAGKVIVTLPSKYLGSRWTYGYLNILGDERLLKLFVADTVEEYTSLATALGTDKNLRTDAENRIKNNIHKLYRSNEAVEEWTKMLLDIAPIRLCVGSEEL